MTTSLPHLSTERRSAASASGASLRSASSPKASLPKAALPSAALSIAELSAARLDGDVYGLDDDYLSVAEPECRRLRARTLAHHLPPGVVLERSSALWVYGVLTRPPVPSQICIAGHRTIRVSTPGDFAIGDFVLREVVLHDGDVVTLGDVQVTSPMRTVIDLARTEVFGRHSVRQLAELMCLERLTFDDIEQRLRVPRNLPHKNVAIRRVRLALAVGRQRTPTGVVSGRGP
jgi:hypothetical protein